MTTVTLGVLAIGDSIANGHGDMVGGVPSQSWGLWLAQALDVPCTKRGAGGATSAQVLSSLPELGARRYDVVALSVGTNDVIEGLSPAAARANFDAILADLRSRAEYVLVSEIQQVIGRPSHDGSALNEQLVAACRQAGAVTCSVSRLNTPRMMKGDRVHPTALGQVEIAERAAEALAAAGCTVRQSPTSLTVHDGRPRLGVGYRIRRWLDPTHGVARHAMRGSAKAAALKTGLRHRPTP